MSENQQPVFHTELSEEPCTYRVILGTQIREDTLNACASLFSSHYGIWGEQAAAVSRFTQPGVQRFCSRIGRDPNSYRL
jgi:hypothetical protein